MRALHRSNVKRYLAAAVLLLSGIAVGAVGMQFWMMHNGPGFPPPPGQFRQRIFEHFVDEVRLTPDQIEKIRPEFEQAWLAGEKIRQTVEPQLKAIMDESENRIREYLTPEQQQLMVEMRKRMEERHRQRGDGPPPPPFDMPPPGPRE